MKHIAPTPEQSAGWSPYETDMQFKFLAEMDRRVRALINWAIEHSWHDEQTWPLVRSLQAVHETIDECRDHEDMEP